MNRILLFVAVFFINLTTIYSQCNTFPLPASVSKVGTDQNFCIDGAVTTLPNVTLGANNYITVNVIKGFNYTFTIPNIWETADGGSAIEYLGVYNDASGNALITSNSSTNGATINSWVATFSGKVRILLLRNNNCSTTTSIAKENLTLTLNSIGNTQDSQTSEGNNTWVGHIYNWTVGVPPGGTSPASPSATNPFDVSQYAGYYNVASESISEGFGGDNNCFNVLSNGVQLATIRTEQFAVRYRMNSTRPAGCYMATINGDDGVRLYVDGVLVFDRWVDQSPNSYGNLLINLKGNSNLVLDYYENGGGNVVNFSLTPFDLSSNTATAPSPAVVSSGVQPGLINGSAYIYNGGTINPTIKYQWQSAPDVAGNPGTWTNLSGQTLQNYQPVAVTCNTLTNTTWYRRVVSAVAANASNCVFNSNAVAITTNAAPQPTVPVTTAGSAVTCSQVIANWSASSNTVSYLLDVATDSGFTNILPSYSNLNVGNITSYSITNLAPSSTYYYRVRAKNSCFTSVSSGTISFSTVAFVPSSQVATYKFCIDNPATNILTTATVNSGQYVTLDVVKGFSYSFSVGDVFSGINESLNVLDASSNNNVSPSAFSSAAAGTAVNWIATFSGQIKIVLSTSDCSNLGATGGPLQLQLKAVGNTLDSQTNFGSNSWVGHVYNWTGGLPLGGASASTPEASSTFVTSNYAGYYNEFVETISQDFGGDSACFSILSNGVNRTNIYADKFAVRYRMQSTKTGCYLATMNGDDGFRLYVDGALVFDSWTDKGNTAFSSVLIYLTGTSKLVFDYYENGGSNVVGFSMAPFVATSNTITATTTSVCSGTAPGTITGSFAYNGTTPNPTINFQWQSAPDVSGVPGTWTDIAGATLQNYTPAAVTTTTSNVKLYYRRNAVGNTTNTSACSFTSNVISITTSAPLGAIGTISGLVAQCKPTSGMIYSVAAVTNAITYVWTVPANWTITAGAGTNSITVSIAANGAGGNVAITASNACGNTNASKAVTVNAPPTFSTQPQPLKICEGTSGAFTIATAAASPTYQWQYAQNSAGPWANTSAVAGVSGHTSSTLTLTNAPLAYSGYYARCVVTSGGCSITSNEVSLTVSPNLVASVTISANPSGAICAGTSVTFTATPTNGGTTPTYQWKLNGGNVGSGTSSYTTSALTNGNTVSVVMSSNATPCLTGSPATSNTITMVVNNLPGTPTVGTPTNVGCSLQGSIPLSNLPAGSWTITQTGTTATTYAGSGTTYTVQSLGVGTYYFTVNNGSCTSAITSAVVITNSSTTTWNGTAWSNGNPTTNKGAIISSVTPNSPFLADLTACTLTISTGVVATVPSGITLTIVNAVTTSGQLIFENTASLVQINDLAVNTGNIEYRRKSQPMNNFDFTYWGSPVTGTQTLYDLSPNTFYDKYWKFESNKWATIMNGAGLMEKARGYAIRVPKPLAAYPNGESVPTTPYAQPVAFKGTPNNGVINLPLQPSGSYNLIGNPYPSALDADQFISENSLINNRLDGTIYFWTHNTPIANKAYAGISDYAAYNISGGVAATSGGSAPAKNIGSGQAFFMSSTGSGSAVFRNSMRVTTSNSNVQFYRGTKSKTVAIDKSRVWLDLKNKDGLFKQTLVGYIDGATNGLDNGYDGESFDGNKYIDFYSVNNTQNLTIQGRSVPFVPTDEVPLGYKTTIEGTFSISLNEADGVLKNRSIFVEDRATKTIHNLKNGPYSFTTVKGTFNDRFVLVYVDKSVVVPPVVIEPPVVVVPPVVVTPPVVESPVVVVPPVSVTPPVQEPPVVVVPPVVVTPPVVEPPVVVIPPVVVVPPVVVTPPVAEPPVVVTPPVVAPPVVVIPPVVVTPPTEVPPVLVVDPTLENPEIVIKGRPLVVSVNNHQIKINSFDEIIANLMVYDLRGRLLYEKSNINTNEFMIQHLNSSDQFLIVITQLVNGKWITKEIVFKN